MDGIIFMHIASDIINNIPDVIVLRGLGFKNIPVPLGNMADAPVYHTAIDGYGFAVPIFQDHIGPQGKLVLTLLVGEIHQNVYTASGPHHTRIPDPPREFSACPHGICII